MPEDRVTSQRRPAAISLAILSDDIGRAKWKPCARCTPRALAIATIRRREKNIYTHINGLATPGFGETQVAQL